MNILRKIRNSRPDKDEKFYSAIKKVVGFNPKNIDDYKEAFTHSSLKKINPNGGYPLL